METPGTATSRAWHFDVRPARRSDGQGQGSVRAALVILIRGLCGARRHAHPQPPGVAARRQELDEEQADVAVQLHRRGWSTVQLDDHFAVDRRSVRSALSGTRLRSVGGGMDLGGRGRRSTCGHSYWYPATQPSSGGGRVRVLLKTPVDKLFALARGPASRRRVRGRIPCGKRSTSTTALTGAYAELVIRENVQLSPPDPDAGRHSG